MGLELQSDAHVANWVALPVPVDRCNENVANYENCIAALPVGSCRQVRPLWCGLCGRLFGTYNHPGFVRCSSWERMAGKWNAACHASSHAHVVMHTSRTPPPWPPCSVRELRRPGYKTKEPRRQRTLRRRRNVAAP